MAEIPLKAVVALVWPLMVKAKKQTENGCQYAICALNLNKISQLANIPLKAAVAFVWPLMVKATKQTENGCQ